MGARVMIMAGGTGGHVFPALAVAEELRRRGLEVFWLGARDGFEAGVVPAAGFRAEWISIRGLRGKGIGAWLTAPVKILIAMVQVWRVLRRNRPGLVLGMGGFVTGPGGVMARVAGIPLVIHEQNALPGLTNRWLARIANRVLEAFPGSFGDSGKAELVGNPVRPEIAALAPPSDRMADRNLPRRLLILGGSLGAEALNRVVPAALALLPPEQRPQVRHQAGRGKEEETGAAYRSAGVAAEVSPFVQEMAEAYGWADLVVCRAGALTISELAAAGVGSILVPYPFAVDDHQTRNAAYLVQAGAARMVPQSELTAGGLAALLRELLSEKGRLLAMATTARTLARPGATVRVADFCEEALTA
jgi:UDP-N-acetylglucosamine--N-acetylmuramyl-(pentapeptide) pyrophosphoryl-undecaprenol N-acetylglucosamine transferase